MTGQPRPEDDIELGLRLRDELEICAEWVAVAGKSFWQRLELILSLTNELGSSWVVVFCYFAEAGPVSGAEISTALRLDSGEVGRCVERLEEKGLLEETPLSGVYALAGDQSGGDDGDGR